MDSFVNLFPENSGIITLVFVASTITTAVFGYAQKVELLVIPVPLLFAFTQLRSTMPGAPNGFGNSLFIQLTRR
jgi:hypothetical protein